MRHQLRYLSLDERVLWSGPPHGRLEIGSDVMQSISSNALKDQDSYKRTVSLRVPSDIWGHQGAIRLDMALRLSQIEPGNDEYPWTTDETALQAGLMMNAHFEVPGHRARWSWHAEALLRVQVRAEIDEGNHVHIAFENAMLEQMKANLPWDDEAMPDRIEDIIYNGMAAGIDAILLENQDVRIPIMEISALNLTNMQLPVRLKDAEFDADSRALVLHFYTALRPISRGATRNVVPPTLHASQDGIAVQIPASVFNAALRQQSLRGAMPTHVPLSPNDGDRTWSALWRTGQMNENRWAGIWSAWCFEGDPCQQTDLHTRLDVREQDGSIVLDETPMLSTNININPTGEGPTILSHLQRSTLRGMLRGMVEWVEREDALGGMHMSLDAIELQDNMLNAAFSLH